MALGASAALGGPVTLVSQTRTLTVATSADAASQTASSADVGPFTPVLGLTATFTGTLGPATNAASGRIDCQVDPNAIAGRGAFVGVGGENVETGAMEFGDAKVSVAVTFTVTQPTAYVLVAAPKPALAATDDFLLEFKETSRNDRIIRLELSDPAQLVNMSGTLGPGTYSFKYRAEAQFTGQETERPFSFALWLGCRGDFDADGSIGVDDLFAFLSAWFAGDARTDFDGSGQIDVPDIFSYLSAYFAGC